jgi:flagellin-like protein
MKALKKNDMGVSPVIAVILMVAITVVLAGVVFLWAQSFTDDAEGGVETVNVKASLYEDTAAALDKIEIEVISGTMTWSEYTVTIESNTATLAGSTSAGGTATATGDWTLVKGTEYTIKIVNIGENKVVWEDDVIALSYASS